MKPNPPVLLLAEDNPAHAKLVLRCLQDQQLTGTVHHVSDGEAVLDYLMHRGAYANLETSPRPSLILLDLRMPKIDGLEVLQQIKASAELRRIPVVILTTSDTETDVVQAYERHANSYLVKPIDFDRLAELVRDLEHYWLDCNRLPCG